mgnify:CR=1 FL=1
MLPEGKSMFLEHKSMLLEGKSMFAETKVRRSGIKVCSLKAKVCSLNIKVCFFKTKACSAKISDSFFVILCKPRKTGRKDGFVPMEKCKNKRRTTPSLSRQSSGRKRSNMFCAACFKIIKAFLFCLTLACRIQIRFLRVKYFFERFF